MGKSWHREVRKVSATPGWKQVELKQKPCSLGSRRRFSAAGTTAPQTGVCGLAAWEAPSERGPREHVRGELMGERRSRLPGCDSLSEASRCRTCPSPGGFREERLHGACSVQSWPGTVHPCRRAPQPHFALASEFVLTVAQGKVHR